MIPIKLLPAFAALLAASPSVFTTAMPGTAMAESVQAVTDTTILARVNDRPITVLTFRQSYYATPNSDRPASDSLGRVEYLNSLVTKEVLGISALAIHRPLDFTDRSKLRQERDEVLANTLYQRMVEDSVRVTEQDIRAAHAQFDRDLRLREMRFMDRTTAETVRRELIAGTTTWEDAARTRAIQAMDPVWVKRKDVTTLFALRVFDLMPGQVSRVIADGDGVHLYQVLERRSVDPPAYVGLRRYLLIQLRSAKSVPYVEQLNDRIRKEMGVVYDTANVRWVASHVGDTRGVKPGEGGATIEVTPTLPDFSPGDLKRVLVRWNDGQITLGEMLPKYSSRSPFLRGSLNSFEAVRTELDGMIFGPTMARMAERMGMESDSVAQAILQRKTEGIRVEHLFRDSVESKVRPTEAEIRAYYDHHPEYFHSVPRVRWAGIPRATRKEAVEVYERLRAGEHPAAILLADSLAGRPVGSIQVRAANEHGPYQRELFEEMVPGEVKIVGPHSDGSYAVLKLLARYPSVRMPYDQVQTEVANVVRSAQTEARLQALVHRLSRGMKIIKRPELLMRMNLTDPSNEIHVDD